MRIGSVEIPFKAILAPMAGCTDLAFRLIAREHGAKFCFFEMVDCNSITHGRKRTVNSILRTNADDLPIAAQLLGRGPDEMLSGARQILSIAKVSFLDINAACPVKKVLKKRAGAYLLKDTEELCGIIGKLSAGLKIPVTVKIRTGFDKSDPIKTASTAKKCESSGASAIFIHGRSMADGYAGDVDYDSIRAAKESVRIPVVGSGDIFSVELAGEMLRQTGCDAVLVARGALGNPWIFRSLEKISCARAIPITPEARKEVLKKHLLYIERFSEPGHPCRLGYMRKVALWYIKGIIAAKRIRQKVSLVKSYEKMIELIDNL
jgi:tRNA-dihydrouridine synthase B